MLKVTECVWSVEAGHTCVECGSCIQGPGPRACNIYPALQYLAKNLHNGESSNTIRLNPVFSSLSYKGGFLTVMHVFLSDINSFLIFLPLPPSKYQSILARK